MDESIRNAEKLIAAANTALARMRCDSSPDDFAFFAPHGSRDGRKGSDPDSGGEVCAGGREEERDFFDFGRRNSSHGSNIEEINSKIEAYKRELEEKEKRKSLREWHFNRDELEMKAPAKKTVSDSNVSIKSAKPIGEDLKIKLRQTQEIVDRGIQTARELSETVENLKNKSARSNGAGVDEVSASRSSEKLTKKCRKCNEPLQRKFRKKPRDKNVSVLRIRGRDSSPLKNKNLNYQELPSLNIHGDLMCQRVHNIEILPGEVGPPTPVENTAFQTFTHDEIIADKMENILRDIKKWNSFIPPDDTRKGRSVECSKCGALVRTRDKPIDSERIDELLRICDYNVFDPRIDEFVEGRCAMREEEAKGTQTEDEPEAWKKKKKKKEEEKEPEEAREKPREEPREEKKKKETRKKISDLSREITRKYREKVCELESDHLEFESILRDLFGKVEESRAVFNECQYLNRSTEEKRKPELRATKPVLLSFTGSVEEIDDGDNAVIRPKRRQKMTAKDLRKRLGRKEIEVNCKVLSSSRDRASGTEKKTGEEVGGDERREPGMQKACEKPKMEVKRGYGSGNKDISTSPGPGPDLDGGRLEPEPSPPPDAVHVNLDVAEEPSKKANTESDYESDFEEESIEEPPKAVEFDDKSFIGNGRLSTISEVDSEEEEKIKDSDKGEEGSAAKSNGGSGKGGVSPGGSSDDDTRKLLKKVNRDLEEVASLSVQRVGAARNGPEKMSEPLKEVLHALKNQFERTEILADKLTESIKEVSDVKKTEKIFGASDIVLVNNLEKARRPDLPGKVPLEDEFPDADPEEFMMRRRGRRRRKKSSSEDVSLIGSKENSEDKSYSEGEISEMNVLCTEISSPSVGEIIDENGSDGSLSEENSVIKFL